MSQLTSPQQVRWAFWENIPGLSHAAELRIKRRRADQDFRTDVRCAFVEYVDQLHREGRISEQLASRVTLA